MKKKASALLVVMAAMTGLTLLMTSWWQAVGWAGDLMLVRQQTVTRFYATEMVRNLAVAWVKKSFNKITDQQRKKRQPVTMDGGTVYLGSAAHGPRAAGRCTVVIDQLPGDDQRSMVRVTVTMMVDGHQATCHRCLVEREMVGSDPRFGAPRFVVHHVAFR